MLSIICQILSINKISCCCTCLKGTRVECQIHHRFQVGVCHPNLKIWSQIPFQTRNNFFIPHLRQHTKFHTDQAKLYVPFHTKSARKPYPKGYHISVWSLKGSTTLDNLISNVKPQKTFRVQKKVCLWHHQLWCHKTSHLSMWCDICADLYNENPVGNFAKKATFYSGSIACLIEKLDHSNLHQQ